MKINETVQEIHALAVSKGWWTESPDSPARHMLMVMEIAEATASLRKGEPPIWFGKDGKPEGEAIELVDCIDRIFDYFGQRGWDLEATLRTKMEFNKMRPARSGGKVI